jgi:ADP-heptose:LPS heptosyltransferase
MRELDTILGLPAAWLLGFRLRSQRTIPQKPRQVVVVKMFGMGSIIAAVPALEALKKAQPQVKLSLVTFANHNEIGTLLNVFDEVLPIRIDRMRHIIRDGIIVLKRLRKMNVDAVIDLEYFSKFSTVFSACAKARYQLGFLLPVRWRSRLLDGGIAFREDIHFSECVARLLAPWGVSYTNIDTHVSITVPASAEKEAAELIEPFTGETLVLINPNAHEMCFERRWPAEKFIELVELLVSLWPQTQFGFIGSPSEKRYVEELCNRFPENLQPQMHMLAGRTSLPVLCGLLKRANLLVTNDSGVMHLAAALNVPLVALFGPESPLRYGPLESAARCRVVAADVVCGPCLSYMNHKMPPCRGNNICMQTLSVETVREECEDMLQQGRAVPVYTEQTGG